MSDFEIEVRIRPEDIDEPGHVNNVVYLRWIQDVAVAHWKVLSTPEDRENLVWVVTRHEIDYKRPAMPEDSIIARTWVGPATRFRFERHTEIRRTRDGAILARARTEWCPIDRSTGRPAIVSPRVRSVCSTAAIRHHKEKSV
jgi:acyl-CoA thioester hydrolase